MKFPKFNFFGKGIAKDITRAGEKDASKALSKDASRVVDKGVSNGWSQATMIGIAGLPLIGQSIASILVADDATEVAEAILENPEALLIIGGIVLVVLVK